MTRADAKQLQSLRRAYERYWRKMNCKGAKLNPAVWLKRGGAWGDDGYMQPITHFDWLAFKAGADYAAQRVRK